jgi:putative flavoprotein involved in K+ transport
MVLPGVGRDAAYVADRVAERSRRQGKTTRDVPTAA